MYSAVDIYIYIQRSRHIYIHIQRRRLIYIYITRLRSRRIALACEKGVVCDLKLLNFDDIYFDNWESQIFGTITCAGSHPRNFATHCSTLQRSATRCNTLQHMQRQLLRTITCAGFHPRNSPRGWWTAVACQKGEGCDLRRAASPHVPQRVQYRRRVRRINWISETVVCGRCWRIWLRRRWGCGSLLRPPLTVTVWVGEK